MTNKINNAVVTLNNGRALPMFNNSELTEHVKEIDRLQLAGRKSAFAIACHVVDVVANELYKEDFKTDVEFCQFVDVNPSLLSQWKTAVPYLRKNKNAVKLGYTLKRAYIYSTLEKAGLLEGFQKYCMKKNLDISTDNKLEEARKQYYKSIGKGKAGPEKKPSTPDKVEVVDSTPDNEVVTAKDTELAGGKKFVTIQYKDSIISIPRKDFQNFIKKYC